MKRKLILHIGMGKTGSTSIQRTLKTSKSQLLTKGIKYLGLMLEEHPLETDYPWHFDFGWSNFISSPIELREKQLTSALIEINNSLPEDVHTLIWSNESFFEGIGLLKKILASIEDIFDIQIIGYIRSPGGWIQSAYMQWGIKHKTYNGPLKPFKAWTNQHPYRVMMRINEWLDFNRKSMFFNFDAVPNITEHFVNNYASTASKDISLLRSNDTPSPVAMALFAYHNSLSESQVLPNEIMPLLHLSGLLEPRQKTPTYNKLLPTQEDITEYENRFIDEIHAINTYFESIGQPGFKTGSTEVKDRSVTQNEVNRALLELIVHLEKQVNNLRNEIKKASNK